MSILLLKQGLKSTWSIVRMRFHPHMPQSIMSKQDFDNIAEIHSLKALSKEAILIRVGIWKEFLDHCPNKSMNTSKIINEWLLKFIYIKGMSKSYRFQETRWGKMG